MRVGIIGLGKLGLPVALAIQAKGFDVIGHDRDERIVQGIIGIQTGTFEEVVRDADLIFVAVQTPHEPEYEGVTRLPDQRADFDYSYVVNALALIERYADRHDLTPTVAVISTCLPGTYERVIKPHLSPRIRYVYNPFFVAMGSVVEDFYAPEFVLIGHADDDAADLLEYFYGGINTAPIIRTDVATAEAIKVSYNSFVTMKTVLANTWGELAQRLGLNVDDIYRAWSMSTDRLLSPRYLEAGMGDGGSCHPRDNIALSWLARKVGLSHDLFGDLMQSREDHAEWIAGLCVRALDYDAPVCILGRSFKAGTNIETGSPALLVANILAEWGYAFEHVEQMPDDRYDCYLIATKHARYSEIAFPEGATVIDPFGIVADQANVNVVRLGRP